MNNKIVFPVFIAACLCLWSGVVHADESQPSKDLTALGVKIVEAKGVAIEAQVADATKWTDEDFKKLAGLGRVRNLSFGKGVDDRQLALLAPMQEVAYFSMNASTVSDAGVKSIGQFKKLRTLKFFHPGKTFTGVGLADLKDLAELKSLTVAGSAEFGDEGIAAVAKLPGLTEFRTWHAGQTLAGVANLKAMKSLTNLNLGQRLAYKPPVAVSDETVGIIAEIPTLEALQLSEAKLSLKALLKLKSLAKLKTLTLDGIQIEEADVKKLTAELPGVQVKWTPPNETYQRRIKALFPEEGKGN